MSIIRKPTRFYPLPQNIRDLDKPYAAAATARHIRIDSIFKEGFTPGDNPFINRAGSSPSDILSKL